MYMEINSQGSQKLLVVVFLIIGLVLGVGLGFNTGKKKGLEQGKEIGKKDGIVEGRQQLQTEIDALKKAESEKAAKAANPFSGTTVNPFKEGIDPFGGVKINPFE